MTHAQVATGTGGTTAATRVQIGTNITLPAGGPWLIHGVWAQQAQTTAVTAEPMIGTLEVESLSGDLTPDPAPGRFPIAGYTSPVSASYGAASMPLNIYRVRWVAAGKAVIALYHNPDVTLAVAPRVVAGIIYSDVEPEAKPLLFVDRVNSAFAATTEQTIGTITLSEKVKRIIGICGLISHTGTQTADEPVIGTFRLTSDDVKIVPLELPFNQAIGPGDGTVAGAVSIGRTQFIPVSIEVPGGSRVTALATTLESVPGSAEVSVYVAAE